MSIPAQIDDQYPGESLGLPERGRGSLATWNARLAALVIDWFAGVILCRLLFGPGVQQGLHWQAFTPYGMYFLQKGLLTALAGGSFGQLVCRIGVIRTDHAQIGWWRPFVRAALKLLVVPAVVIGAERRALDDIMLGTVVVNRR